MDDLESRGGVVEDGREVSLIPGANLSTSVTQHNVTDFKEFERQWHLSIGLDRLEKSRQQRGTRHLELEGLWVGNVHGWYLLYLLSHLQANVVPGAEGEGECLSEASLGHCLSQLVRQLVHWQLLSHSQSLWDR